jgi:hypothetical protein
MLHCGINLGQQILHGNVKRQALQAAEAFAIRGPDPFAMRAYGSGDVQANSASGDSPPSGGPNSTSGYMSNSGMTAAISGISNRSPPTTGRTIQPSPPRVYRVATMVSGSRMTYRWMDFVARYSRSL